MVLDDFLNRLLAKRQIKFLNRPRKSFCTLNGKFPIGYWAIAGDGPSCVVDFRDPGVRAPECGWSRVRCF